MKNWTRIERNTPYVKVYEHVKTGAIKIVYPKAPKWAQKAAMLIYLDNKGGPVTEKGVKDIVLGLWAKIIFEASK